MKSAARPGYEIRIEDCPQPVRGLFFLNGSGQIPMAFVQALTALDFRPVLLSGPSDVKVVDVAILRTLEALAERGHGDVLLASHDGDFAPAVATSTAAAAATMRIVRVVRIIGAPFAFLYDGRGTRRGRRRFSSA